MKVVHCKKESYDVLIDRTTKWGNPFIIGRDGDRDEVVEKHEEWLLDIISAPNGEKIPSLKECKEELGGKILGCWCAPRACHGDTLLRFANYRKADSNDE